MARYEERIVGVINWANNALSAPLHIERIDMMRKLNLRLTVNVTKTVAAFTDADPENPQSLIKRINVHANGRLPKSIRGEELFVMNKINRGVAGERNPLAGNEATGTYNIDCDLELNFQSIGMKPKALTNLASWSFSSLFIEILWGTILDLTTDANAVINSASVTVVAYYDKTNLSRLSANIERNIIKDVVAANPQFQIDLDVGTLYRSFLIKSEDGASMRPVNNIINSVTLKMGDILIFDRVPWLQLQNDNKYNYQAESWLDGYAIIDFPKKTGNWNRLLDARYTDTLKFFLDVNAGTAPQIVIHLTEINARYLL